MNYSKQNYALKVLKNLANANRIKILDLLIKNADKKITVNQICQELDMEQGKVSNHLAKMRSDNIVRAKQIGLNMFYSIKDQNAVNAIKLLMK